MNDDKIYDGAMDDASGVASVMEIARTMQLSPVKPKRSILFLVVTAEEKGLLGSEYFASHPTVKGTIIADINMDMSVPLFPPKFLEAQGLGESTIGDDVTAAAKAAGVEVQAGKQPDHVRFIGSDQYSFIKKGAVTRFQIWMAPGHTGKRILQRLVQRALPRREGRRHSTGGCRGRCAVQHHSRKLALRVANADSRPSWNPDSFFKQFATAAD